MTQLQASASAGREPWGVSVQTANQASGASPAAAPVSVTAMQTSVTPALGSVQTVGTIQQDTSVNGKAHSVIVSTCLHPACPTVAECIIHPSCVGGFFGNPVLGSGEHCRPCPCPGNPGSDHFNGHSCQADHTSNQIICNCRQGYTGNSSFLTLILVLSDDDDDDSGDTVADSLLLFRNPPQMSKLIVFFSFFVPKGFVVTSVPLVTMATQSKPEGSAYLANAMATLTPRILSHVTPGPASASGACTTPTVCPVPTVNMVTMATLWPKTADVSDDSRY